jgi:hypothetical protein
MQWWFYKADDTFRPLYWAIFRSKLACRRRLYRVFSNKKWLITNCVTDQTLLSMWQSRNILHTIHHAASLHRELMLTSRVLPHYYTDGVLL